MKKIPSSVYRLQLSSEFTLKKVTELIPYFADLGIDGLYCSPIFEAFSHGYDITNPNRLNPTLGSIEDFETLCRQMQKRGMKFILDVVPNHMGIKGNKNEWWNDVLENGQASSFADFFDINWTPEKVELRGKILLPVLNKPYGNALDSGDIQLVWDHGFWIRYFDYLFSIRYLTYPQILESLPKGSFVLSKSKERFIAFYEESKSLQESIETILSHFNKEKELLHALLEKQFYRLSYWVVAGQEINYRRFFNINELVAIHIEKENVLQAHHQWVFQLLEEGQVQGLRIDHPDGLYDPSQYFERIRQKKAEIIWIEKIVDFGETLPQRWDVDGTVGYDFLNILSGVFIQKDNEQKITEIYNRFIHNGLGFKKIHYERRKQYIVLQMSSEINFLGALLDKISDKDLYFRDLTKIDLTKACLEIVACFPVYRTYIKPDLEIRTQDRNNVLAAVEMAKKKAPEVDSLVFDFIQKLLLLEYSESKDLAVDFLLRFQQLTPPVMAKGLEDSTFYIYNRLISLNEVGGNPHYFGYTPEEFHTFNRQKLSRWPLGLLPSSTHDTKYSEDARLRIHALSELPKEWANFLRAAKIRNRKHKTLLDGKLIPDANTEYFIYQILLALWPADFKRLWICINKAIREAGINTSWRTVNETYEKAVKKFLKEALKQTKASLSFHKMIAEYGFMNSLSALVLKIGSCGIVDIYQGSEIMNYSLMDPDNRRPVDFEKRKDILAQMEDLKMYVTARGLNFRREHKELFLKGEYIALKSPKNTIAFLRSWKNRRVLVVVRRFFSEEEQEMGTIKIPKNLKIKEMQDVFTDRTVSISEKGLELEEVFKEYPFAILSTTLA